MRKAEIYNNGILAGVLTGDRRGTVFVSLR